ncbi:MAG: hypothetical protein WBW79_15990 [Desulfocapsaceae bacterium]
MNNAHPDHHTNFESCPNLDDLDRVAISVKSHHLLHQLLSENPELERIMQYAKTEIEALLGVRTWVLEALEKTSGQRPFTGQRSGVKTRIMFCAGRTWGRFDCSTTSTMQG